MYALLGCQSILIIHFTNFIHASNWPLLWWWYDDVMVCWVFILLQKALNVLAMKFVPTSETIFFRSLYSAKTAWPSTLSCPLIRCLLSSLLGICCGNLQYIEEFTIDHDNISTNHFPWPACYFIMQCFFLELYSLVLQACGTLLDLCVLCQHSLWSSVLILSQGTMSSQSPCGCCASGQISPSVMLKV